jgi:hypothetical protein
MLPKFFQITQPPTGPRLADPCKTIQDGFVNKGWDKIVRDKTIAVCIGSRGIRNINIFAAAVIDAINKAGGKVFIVPAMGSHGGGTEEGQMEILRSFNVHDTCRMTEFRPSMEVEQIGTFASGSPIYFCKAALEADYIIPINRVKGHPTFTGRFESGIMKMMAIGLGKKIGAGTYHREMAKEAKIPHPTKTAFERVIGEVGKAVLATGKILGAFAIVENGNQEAALIEAISAKDLPDAEIALLERAKEWTPKLPFSEIDLLVIEEMGKDISATGIDTTVIGEKTGYPQVKLVYVRGLTKNTAGNASGIGLANLCHGKILKQIDYKKTYTNCLTSGFPEKASIPINFDTDTECLEAALSLISSNSPKIVWIKNTLELTHILASEALLEQARISNCQFGELFELGFEAGDCIYARNCSK